MLKIGDTLPSATVYEYIEVEGNGCSLGPNAFDVAKACAGKKIAIFALPGAYTLPQDVQNRFYAIPGVMGIESY